MATITKTVYEKIPVSWDFAAELEPGETIQLVSVTVKHRRMGTDSTAEMISSEPAPGISGSKVNFWVDGGLAGESYLVSIKVTTSGGQELEGLLYLDISG